MEKITLEDFLKLESLENIVFAFPTDTVFGVGCLYDDFNSVERIYNLKKRTISKKIPVLCSNLEMAKTLAIIEEKDLVYTKFWPGALTLIFNTKNLDTIALRIPNSNTCLKLINKFGPLKVTSVNISGEKELNSVEEIIDKFDKEIDYIIIDNYTLSKVPSKIIDLTQKTPKIIRN